MVLNILVCILPFTHKQVTISSHKQNPQELFTPICMCVISGVKNLATLTNILIKKDHLQRKCKNHR